MGEFIRLFNTVKYLKFKQIVFRLFYFGRARMRKIIGFKYEFSKESKSTPLKLTKSCDNYSFYCDNEFSILNLSKKFDPKIDWNYKEYGKLWTYNLTYFEYLKEKSYVKLIYDFIASIEDIQDGLEPFPISLRGINWIKFLVQHQIKDKKIDNSLYAQYYILLDNLEYHLLGNHLLENGFSLLFGAYYFQDEKLYKKAKNILEFELSEQVLSDGAHFELSPMYHQIMLFRVLDCINLVQNNSWKQDGLLTLMREKAIKMLNWLDVISYSDGTIPHFNDSTDSIAPTTKQLIDYSDVLELDAGSSNENGFQIKSGMTRMLVSGYRKIVKSHYECIVDVGRIGPDYIPGHAHADTFNFELRIAGKPFVVNTGLSTYEIGKRRDFERGTTAHNTVVVNGQNSSDIWGGFRVAERANIVALYESDNRIGATHDGYRKLGVLHTRTFEFYDNQVVICDELGKDAEAKAYLHFHPDVTEEEIQKRIITNQQLQITHYDYALGFNKILKALAIEISFKKDLKVEITL